MTNVHLRPMTTANYQESLNLQVAESQDSLVASNAKSLAEASVNPALVPLAIYDVTARGYAQPLVPMIGFTMYEVTAGVGFIERLMIDRAHQRQGYGRAAMLEVIRRLKLYPEVEVIATSHRRENQNAAALYHSLGFADWDIGWAQENPMEVFLLLMHGSVE
ncbi:MAG: GNAT family N-acetyltransferase [Herpetosiphonaceae bacterium]|nr:GNAT family N-acetyltransferase [Herpetosiphonaceae bacterium]